MVMDRLRRWFVFNAIGLAGFVVQLTTLAALVRVVHLHDLVATAVAVEAAVLHNFWWHQRVTWSDRPVLSQRAGLGRLWRFQLTNGAISLTGNVGIVWALTTHAGLEPVAASIVAIVICSMVNFAASDTLVFE